MKTLDILYKSYGVTKIYGVIWGHGGQNKRSNFQVCPISKVEVSNCSSWSIDQKCSWWPLRPTFPSGVKGQKRSNWGPIFNFNRFQSLRCQIVCIEPKIKSVHGDLFVRPFLQGSKVKERSYMGWIFNFNRFQRLRCQIVCLEPTIKSFCGDLFI